MEGLVSDLLALSKLGQVSCNFQSVPASEIIRNVTSALKPRFKEKGIRLVAGDNFPMIYCDAERMHQVFENLAVNAIKYLGETADPTIEIGFEDTGEAHRFFIRDNGVGIDPAFHRKIFEMFERLKEAEDAEGTGLGLAIVEKIVESHGGKVWVESQKGAGATFYFTLPKRSP
jgi:signal transduction histidine kinase